MYSKNRPGAIIPWFNSCLDASNAWSVDGPILFIVEAEAEEPGPGSLIRFGGN